MYPKWVFCKTIEFRSDSIFNSWKYLYEKRPFKNCTTKKDQMIELRKIVKLIVIVIGLVFIGSGFIALLLDNEQYLLFPFQ